MWTTVIKTVCATLLAVGVSLAVFIIYETNHLPKVYSCTKVEQ